MPMYLLKWAFAPETWQKMMNNPEDRRPVNAALFEAAGGKLHGLWYALGEYDGYTLAEFPDDATAASIAVKAAATGAFTAFSTTKLFTVDEALDVLHRAGGVPYRPPGERA